ncbi:hypothetical protein RL1968 [Rhizobium johnstonii 3841]|uniref:Uncharacterized protein n=1 Tax=Rhizobium johnstonii (strain DSM 114642 / LMG 32736 / 3841) TaxID=216596 RepID=Q1MHU9_RHIJ3|nr:hypothetical protein RL1968 [Rhizobium johnstonii 3841]
MSKIPTDPARSRERDQALLLMFLLVEHDRPFSWKDAKTRR